MSASLVGSEMCIRDSFNCGSHRHVRRPCSEGLRGSSTERLKRVRTFDMSQVGATAALANESPGPTRRRHLEGRTSLGCSQDAGKNATRVQSE
eukprot:13552069-Alexandrium_andersonii.AAC.1